MPCIMRALHLVVALTTFINSTNAIRRPPSTSSSPFVLNAAVNAVNANSPNDGFGASDGDSDGDSDGASDGSDGRRRTSTPPSFEVYEVKELNGLKEGDFKTKHYSGHITTKVDDFR